MSIPLTIEGIRVVPSRFDPYQSSIVAPDHLFCGLARDAINAVLALLPAGVRRMWEKCVLQEMRALLFSEQNCIVSSETGALHSMSMSEMYGVLLFGLYLFCSVLTSFKRSREKIAETTRFLNVIGSSEFSRANGSHSIVGTCIELSCDLQSLVARAFSDPAADIDGDASIAWFNAGNGKDRIDELHHAAGRYVNSVCRICERSRICAKILDKPNVHRLLELFHHTLPQFGNLRIVQELILEQAHQHLKRGIQRSNQKNAQVQAMQNSIANDWASRLELELDGVGGFGDVWEIEDASAVRRLFGDAKWNEIGSESFTETKDAFPSPVLRLLRRRLTRRGEGTKVGYNWVSNTKSEIFLNDLFTDGEEWGLPAAKGLACLRELHKHYPDTGKLSNSRMLREAGFVRNVSCSRGRSSKIFLARIGSVIQVCSGLEDSLLLDSDNILWNLIDGVEEGFLRRRFWVVTMFVEHYCSNTGTRLFAILKPLLTSDEESLVVRHSRSTCFVLQEMTPYVRPAVAIHQCHRAEATRCFYERDSGTLVHQHNTLSGGPFILLGRAEGYPSRRS